MAARVHTSEMIDVLRADGPFPEHEEKLATFGQLVGSWDIVDTHYDQDGSVKVVRHGEWHFDWVLEGRVIQDVIFSPSRAVRAETGEQSYEYGTTVRAYDAKIDAWRVAFVAPIYGAIVNLIARLQGDQVVLEGRSPHGTLYRWVFSEITEESFRWNGHESFDEGRSWFMGEEILGTRRQP